MFTINNINKINLPSKGDGQDYGIHIEYPEQHVQVYIVCDGHSKMGHIFSEECCMILKNIFDETDFEGDLTDKLDNAVKNTDATLFEKFGKVDGGTTLTCTIIRLNERDIWCATVGDSSGYVIYDGIPIAMCDYDQSPLNMDEFLRISTSNPETKFVYDILQRYKFGSPKECFTISEDEGIITNPPPRGYYVKNVSHEPATYVVTDTLRGERRLAMTRSIGDFLFKDKGIICDPIIKHIPFPETSFSLIVATDGLWDCWKEEEIHLLVQDDSLRDTHRSKASDLFGSSRDDTLIFTLDISINDETCVACSGAGC